jgi:hypothetical protein
MMFEELLNKLNKPYNYNVIVSKIGSGRIVESGTFEKLEDAVAYKNRLVEKLVSDEEVRLEDMKGNPVSENKVVEQEPIKVKTDVKTDDGFPRDEIGIANMIDAYIEDCDKADLVNLYNFITGLELTIDDVNWNMSEQVRKRRLGDDGFPRDEIGIANMIDAYIEDCDKADLVNLYNFITGLELTIDDVNWNMSEQVRKRRLGKGV